MAELHLPLTINPAGVYERATAEENIVGSRLRLFILSGSGEYLRLPSPGIRALWIQLYNLGVSSRFCDSMKDDERQSLEDSIRSDVNAWLNEVATINEVKLLGDEREENGIRFRTGSREFAYHFHYALPGKGRQGDAVGPWNIVESSHAIY